MSFKFKCNFLPDFHNNPSMFFKSLGLYKIFQWYHSMYISIWIAGYLVKINVNKELKCYFRIGPDPKWLSLLGLSVTRDMQLAILRQWENSLFSRKIWYEMLARNFRSSLQANSRENIGFFLRLQIEQRFVSSTWNMEVLLSHIHSIVCAYTYF